jgi:putative copper resistance protein D
VSIAASPGLPSLLSGHWQAAWGLDGAAATYAALYLWGTLRLRERWPLRRTASFMAGIGVVLIALQSGVAAYDERLLSAHMVQHMLLLLVAPLLILEGRPLMLILRAAAPEHRVALVRLLGRLGRFTGPYVCLGVFSGALIAAHLPAVFDATLGHPLLHELEHALFIAVGLLFWWPLLDGDPLPSRRLGGLGRVFYLLGSMPAMALVGAYLNRAPEVVYRSYAAPARALGISAVADQQQAAAIMWVGGSCLMIAVGLWVAMASMIAEERRQQARERRGLPAELGAGSGGRPAR